MLNCKEHLLVPLTFAQACSTQAKARVFSCHMAQKSFGVEASVYSMKSAGWSQLSQGGASHHSEASYWARGRLKTATCQWACSRASESPRPSFIRWMPIDTLPLAFSSFYQWGWIVFSISGWIHIQGWLMGSGSSFCLSWCQD